MKYDMNEIEALPETFSLDTFRIACHISKRKARYYLQSGFLPCENNGQKTHCYTIHKKDLIMMLKDYEKKPEHYTPPRTKATSNGVVLMRLPMDDIACGTAKSYYAAHFSEFPELITTKQISSVIGYNQATISTWCKKRYFKGAVISGVLFIQKESFFEFLLSETYNHVAPKSKQHIQAINTIYKSKRRGG